jgi:hypothetical protein
MFMNEKELSVEEPGGGCCSAVLAGKNPKED